MADRENHGEDVIRFKKRRKITHQRRRKCDDSDDDETQNTVRDSTPLLEAPESSAQSESQLPALLSVPEILRKRHAEQAQRKLKAVVQASTRDQRRPSATPLVDDEAKPTIVDVARNRFVPETGKIFTHDKQMDEYVDRKMAELYGNPLSTNTSPTTEDATKTMEDNKAGRYNGSFDDAVFAGKLVEVELGVDAETRATSSEKKAPKKRAGLGPDGKPWRSRVKRRNSADLRRDQLVDQVLRETDVQFADPEKPDVYNDFTLEEQDYADQVMRNDQAIDELVAAKWRNNYLAAQADGKMVRKVPPPPGGVKGEERPKGPKLGGSRMARAQMRLQEEKAVAKKR